ncbi:MAG: RNA methyltransferase [Bacteroidales bacterium]|nr:RNA methyltransferase [Bacteroidales bacterium]MDT8431325.1 RNA methyltransferase [Bacteroidales bacterium]
MLSRNQQKLIRSLQQKKQREIHGLFLIEGNTIITDLVRSGELHAGNMELLAATPEWLQRNAPEVSGLSKMAASSDPGNREKRSGPADVTVPADPSELKKLSALVSPPEVMAVVKMPPGSSRESFRPEQLREGPSLVFESVRDPGNLGTIIRTADWFGIGNLFCSPDSVDTYNNKVVQASMGAVLRTRPVYIELPVLFEEADRFRIPVYGTTMDGDNFYDTPVKVPGLIVFGNEAHGISAHLEPYFRNKIRIPDFPEGTSATESLNVATSVAVVCAEIRRRQR